MRLTDAQAKELGITAEQIRKARLTPTAARYVPEPLTPQDLLTDAVERQWPGETRWNYRPLLGDHNFELDIAFPAIRLGIEVDGWENHGKHKAGFHRDRLKAQHLILADWRVLPFAASHIMKDLPAVLAIIATARDLCAKYAEAEERSTREPQPLGFPSKNDPDFTIEN